MRHARRSRLRPGCARTPRVSSVASWPSPGARATAIAWPGAGGVAAPPQYRRAVREGRCSRLLPNGVVTERTCRHEWQLDDEGLTRCRRTRDSRPGRNDRAHVVGPEPPEGCRAFECG